MNLSPMADAKASPTRTNRLSLLLARTNSGRYTNQRAETHSSARQSMNILLWALQILAALLYASAGVMKLFLSDKISEGVPLLGRHTFPMRAYMPTSQ